MYVFMYSTVHIYTYVLLYYIYIMVYIIYNYD